MALHWLPTLYSHPPDRASIGAGFCSKYRMLADGLALREQQTGEVFQKPRNGGRDAPRVQEEGPLFATQARFE